MSLWINKIRNRKTPRLTKEEFNDLIVKAQAGDMVARNKIVENNLGLIVSVVSKYIGTSMAIPRVEFEDMFQEASMSLYRAIELFDISKGFAFSTYASWWLRQSIERYIDNNKTLIRVPVFACALQRSFHKIQMEYQGHDEDFWIRLIAFENNKTPEAIRNSLKFLNPQSSSIDEVNEDGDPILQLEDLTYELDTTPVDVLQIKKIADLLPAREKDILMKRMDNWSLIAIAHIHKLSKERVRQLEKSALIKLRALVNIAKEEKVIIPSKGETNGKLKVNASKEIRKRSPKPF